MPYSRSRVSRLRWRPKDNASTTMPCSGRSAGAESAGLDPCPASRGCGSSRRRSSGQISDKPAHEALVSEADFVAAQKITARTQPVDGARRAYMLTGLLRHLRTEHGSPVQPVVSNDLLVRSGSDR